MVYLGKMESPCFQTNFYSNILCFAMLKIKPRPLYVLSKSISLNYKLVSSLWFLLFPITYLPFCNIASFFPHIAAIEIESEQRNLKVVMSNYCFKIDGTAMLWSPSSGRLCAAEFWSSFMSYIRHCFCFVYTKLTWNTSLPVSARSSWDHRSVAPSLPLYWSPTVDEFALCFWETNLFMTGMCQRCP